MSIGNPTQQERVLDFMLNAGWKTLAEISEYMAAHGKRIPEASASARLRQFATWQGGKYQMEARRPERQGGQWHYRLTEPRPKQQKFTFTTPGVPTAPRPPRGSLRLSPIAGRPVQERSD